MKKTRKRGQERRESDSRFILSVELNEETFHILTAKADELDRPKGWVLRKALMEWLAQNPVGSTVQPTVSEGVVKPKS